MGTKLFEKYFLAYNEGKSSFLLEYDEIFAKFRRVSGKVVK